jgi:hypothetical protein
VRSVSGNVDHDTAADIDPLKAAVSVGVNSAVSEWSPEANVVVVDAVPPETGTGSPCDCTMPPSDSGSSGPASYMSLAKKLKCPSAARPRQNVKPTMNTSVSIAGKAVHDYGGQPIQHGAAVVECHQHAVKREKPQVSDHHEREQVGREVPIAPRSYALSAFDPESSPNVSVTLSSHLEPKPWPVSATR